jgi:hypothetical protein
MHVYDIAHCPYSLGLTAAMTERYHSTLQGTKCVQNPTDGLSNMRALTSVRLSTRAVTKLQSQA